MEYAIETFDLTKVFKPARFSRFRRKRADYKKEVVAVDHINIKVKQGEFFGLLGPNGAGKTTTIKILCTIILPDDGYAVVNGYNILKEDSKVRASVGVISPVARSLFWRLTGKQNLELFASLYDLPRDLAKKRIDEVLGIVGLTDRANNRVYEYSSGMKNKLIIARSLLPDPPILLCDEPTLGLDPQSAKGLRNLLLQLNRDEGRTILLTTHYMQEADDLCERVAIINKGKIVALDAPDKLKNMMGERDILELEISKPSQDLPSILSKIEGVRSIKTELTEEGVLRVRMHVEDQEKIMPRLLKALERRGFLQTLKHSTPTLEDAFIKLTERQ